MNVVLEMLALYILKYTKICQIVCAITHIIIAMTYESTEQKNLLRLKIKWRIP